MSCLFALSCGHKALIMVLLQVVFEATEGVLLRQEISWRHALDVSALSFCQRASGTYYICCCHLHWQWQWREISQ